MGTFYLAYRVEIWIATDALLMMSVAGALLGCYRGLTADRGWPKLALVLASCTPSSRPAS